MVRTHTCNAERWICRYIFSQLADTCACNGELAVSKTELMALAQAGPVHYSTYVLDLMTDEQRKRMASQKIPIIDSAAVVSAVCKILDSNALGSTPSCADGVSLSAFMALPTHARSALLNAVLNSKALAWAYGASIQTPFYAGTGVLEHGERGYVQDLSASEAVLECADLIGLASTTGSRRQRAADAMENGQRVWGMEGVYDDERAFWHNLATCSQR